MNKKIQIANPFIPELNTFSKYYKKLLHTKIVSNNGPFKKIFTNKLSKFHESKNLCLVSSCTIGLDIALSILPENSEIIKSSSLGSLNSARGKEKVIAICNNISGKKYLNAIGGINLYRKDDFNSAGIDLKFVKSYHSPYQQHTKDFIPGLSIIDIIFSISEKEELHRQIKNFELNDA